MNSNQQRSILPHFFLIFIGLIMQVWTTASYASDIVSQNYASADSPGIQSCTSGYDLLAGDVGYGKTMIQGPLPYTIAYRAPLRENLSAAMVMESQEESTSGWSDNYQSYIMIQSVNYTSTTNTVSAMSPGTAPYTLQAVTNSSVHTQFNLIFAQLPGESTVTIFKDEISTGVISRLYSADPAGDIQNNSSAIESLPWNTDLGEYTVVLSGTNFTITKGGVTYIVTTPQTTVTSTPGYTSTEFTYVNSGGSYQTTAWTNQTSYTPPSGSLSTNAVPAAVITNYGSTTTLQRISTASYPNGKILTFSYDGNNNLTQVTDNRNNKLTFQHNYPLSGSAINQIYEGRLITSVTSQSGSLGDTQTASFSYTPYNVYEPSSGNAVTVYDLTNASSPVAGSYTFTNTLTEIGAIPLYVRQYQPNFNVTTTPDSDYYFPVLTQATNGAGQVEQKWVITQTYTPTYSSGYYSYSTATTKLESYRPGSGSVANAMDMTTTYNDLTATIAMTFSPGGSQTASTATVTTTVGSGSTAAYATIHVTGNYPCLTSGGKPVSSAIFDTTRNRITSITDGKGVFSSYNYDDLSRLTSATQANTTSLSRATTYTYTTLSNGATNRTNTPNTVSAPEINITNTLNTRGQIVSQVQNFPQGGSETPMYFGYTYDENNDASYGLLIVYDAPRADVNDTTSYSYDAYGNLQSKTVYVNNSSGTAIGRQTTYSNYNSAGLPKNISYPDGTSDAITYDSGYRVLQTVHGNSSTSITSSNTYDSLERVITSTDPDNKTTGYSYDVIGRLQTTTYPNGNQKWNTYYPNNSVFTTSLTAPNNGAIAQFSSQLLDSSGRLNVMNVGAGFGGQATTTFSYDANNNVTQTKTGLGIINSWMYDVLNRVSTHTDGLGNVDTKSYDDADNNTNENAANSAGSTRNFKNLNILEAETNVDFGQKLYYHDYGNNVVAIHHVDRQCTFGTVDQIGRPQNTWCTSSNSSSQLLVNDNYTYDQSAFGNLDSSIANISGQGTNTSYTYDAFHRVLSKTQVNNTPASWGYAASHQTVSYNYSNSGLLINMTYPSGMKINLNYNTSTDMLNNIALATGQTLINQITFDGASRLNSFHWGAGGVWQQTINTLGEVTNITNTNSTGGNNFSAAYGYDVDGRLTSQGISVPSGTATASYVYDNDAQLTKETLYNGSTLAYTYDKNGNRTSLRETGSPGLSYTQQDFTYSGTNNQFSGWYENNAGALTLGYTSQGELYNSYKGAATYDGADRRRTETGVPGSTLYTGQYFDYNHKNERTFRGGSYIDRQYAYDESSHLIGEYDANGNTIVEYVWFGDRPIAAVYPGNRIVYLVTDNQSKPRRGIDASSQTIVWLWDPDAFGELQPVDATTGLANGVVVNLRFPGQYYDVQSGLYYNHNRYYNPEIGRYMEPDPTGLEAGLNPYAYTENDPVNNIDPSGLLGYDNLAGSILGLIGGGLSSAGVQYFTHPNHDISIYDVAVAASVGAVAGGVSPYTAGTIQGAVITNSIAGEYQYIATSLGDNQPITMTGLSINMFAGAVAGKAGGSVGIAAGTYESKIAAQGILSSLSTRVNATNVGSNMVNGVYRNFGAAGLGAVLSSDPIVGGAQQAQAQLDQTLTSYQQGNGQFASGCSLGYCTGQFGNQPSFQYTDPNYNNGGGGSAPLIHLGLT